MDRKEINKNITSIFIFASLVLACFPLFSFRLRSIITIIWTILGVYLFLLSNAKPRFNSGLYVFLLPYTALVFSLFWTENYSYGLDLILRMLSFIVYPIVFWMTGHIFHKTLIKQIFYLFSISTFLFVAFQGYHVLLEYDYLFSNLTADEINANGFNSILDIAQEKINQIKLRRFRNFLIECSGSHPTYQGLWISFVVFFLGIELFKNNYSLVTYVQIITIVFLVIWLFLISSRMPVISLIMVSALAILFFSPMTGRVRVYVATTLLGIVALIFIIQTPLSTRLVEFYNTGFELLRENEAISRFNSSNTRNGIYFCDFDVLKDNFLFGLGIGDIQDKLNQCYTYKLSLEIFQWKNYNSHNQYFFFWLSSGLLGIVSFLLFIFQTLRRAIVKKEIILFFIVGISSLVFMTENILERSDGLIFFSFFTSLLYFSSKNYEEI